MDRLSRLESYAGAGRRAGLLRRMAQVASFSVILAALLASGCSTPLSPRRQNIPFLLPDNWPCWSPDGRLIAYHRPTASADGPPGLYVIPATGGTPRFLLQGNELWPEDISFSPDGTRLVATSYFQVVVVDVASGQVSVPFFASAGAGAPTWSPDGNRIAYGRIGNSGDPPESLGVHIFDLRTGRDIPVQHAGEPVIGGQLSWEPIHDRILGLRGSDDGLHMIIEAFSADGDTVTWLDVSQGLTLFDMLRPYRWPATHDGGVVYFANDGSGCFFASAAGRPRRSFPILVGIDDGFSADGLWRATTKWDSDSGAYVLFVGLTADKVGTTYRRLTRWAPPSAPHS